MGLIFTAPPNSSAGRAWTQLQGSQGPCLSFSLLCSVAKTFLILPVTVLAFTSHHHTSPLPSLSYPCLPPPSISGLCLPGFVSGHLCPGWLAVLSSPVFPSAVPLILHLIAALLVPFPSLFSLPSFSLLPLLLPFSLFPLLCQSLSFPRMVASSLCVSASPNLSLLCSFPCLSFSVSLASALMVLPPVSIFIPLTHPLCPLLCLSLPLPILLRSQLLVPIRGWPPRQRLAPHPRLLITAGSS